MSRQVFTTSLKSHADGKNFSHVAQWYKSHPQNSLPFVTLAIPSMRYQHPTADAHLSRCGFLHYIWMTWYCEDAWGCGNQAASGEFTIPGSPGLGPFSALFLFEWVIWGRRAS